MGLGGAALFEGRPLVSVILFGLTPVTRPEAIVLLPLCLPGLARVSRTRGRSLATVGAWLIPLVPVLMWTAFCKPTTGHFLPNTYYLKARPFHLGFDELKLAWKSLFLGGLAPVWAYVLGVAAGVVACCMGPRKVLSVGLLVAAPWVYFCAVIGSRDIFLDGYYWTRWLDPACIMLMIPFCVGSGVVLAGGWSRRRAAGLGGLWPEGLRWRVGILVGLGGVVCLAAAVPSYRGSLGDRRNHLSTDSRAIHIMNVQTGEWIREHTPAASVVAANDAGAIRYFGERRTVNLMGLNNAEIAFHKIGERAVIEGADRIAIFPSWFSRSAVMADIETAFQPRVEMRIPVNEYTICNCPGQTIMVIFERRRPKPALSDTR